MSDPHPFKLPPIGLGTYLLTGKHAEKIIEAAYQLGYRHFDTATFYENEPQIGRALKKVARGSFQITTKVWHEDLGYHSTLNAFDRSLNNLQMDYVDLYLIHWPSPRQLIFETLEAMEELKKKCRVRAYGVSNCTVHHLQEIKNAGFQVAANQVEYHPYLDQQELLTYCLNENIQLIAYSPFIRGELKQEAVLAQIGDKYAKTAAQVTLRWILEKGMVTIPKTSKFQRLEENFNVLDFSLSDQEINQINQLNRNYRMTDPDCGDFEY